jgi:putative Ca2+/H+ antiporter (TMEM165/GDT1 family)
MAGILVATLLNHGLATFAGTWIATQVSAETLRIGLAVIFFAFAAWILIPDKLEQDEDSKLGNYGAFFTTCILFFMAEMGDKTQLATVALAAKFQMPIAVTLGTTLGMLGADGLAVAFGERLTKIIPMKTIRIISSILFAAFGLAILLS